MNSFLNILGKLFGNKYEKDVKEIKPIVEQINSEFEKLKNLDNNELRNKTVDLKKQIQEFIAFDKEEIQRLKQKSLLKSTSTQEKEDIYKKIDALQKTVLEKTEEILNKILPTAFAVIKETSRRFAINETIEVLASENDRKLAESKDFISIKNTQAIYQTKWKAAGTNIKWDMVH